MKVVTDTGDVLINGVVEAGKFAGQVYRVSASAVSGAYKAIGNCYTFNNVILMSSKLWISIYQTERFLTEGRTVGRTF